MNGDNKTHIRSFLGGQLCPELIQTGSLGIYLLQQHVVKTITEAAGETRGWNMEQQQQKWKIKITMLRTKFNLVNSSMAGWMLMLLLLRGYSAKHPLAIVHCYCKTICLYPVPESCSPPAAELVLLQSNYFSSWVGRGKRALDRCVIFP